MDWKRKGSFRKQELAAAIGCSNKRNRQMNRKNEKWSERIENVLVFLFPSLCVVMHSVHSISALLRVPSLLFPHGEPFLDASCAPTALVLPQPWAAHLMKMDSGPKPLTPETDISSSDSCHWRGHLSAAVVGSSLF